MSAVKYPYLKYFISKLVPVVNPSEEELRTGFEEYISYEPYPSRMTHEEAFDNYKRNKLRGYGDAKLTMHSIAVASEDDERKRIAQVESDENFVQWVNVKSKGTQI